MKGIYCRRICREHFLFNCCLTGNPSKTQSTVLVVTLQQKIKRNWDFEEDYRSVFSVLFFYLEWYQYNYKLHQRYILPTSTYSVKPKLPSFFFELLIKILAGFGSKLCCVVVLVPSQGEIKAAFLPFERVFKFQSLLFFNWYLIWHFLKYLIRHFPPGVEININKYIKRKNRK